MATHYDIDNGVTKTGRFRTFLFAFAGFGIGIAGIYTLALNLNSQTEAEQSNTSYNQSAAPAPTTVQAKLDVPINWPDYGHSAYGTVKDGQFAVAENNSDQVPIASLAKVITALAVLKAKPLQPGEQGPMITLTESDVELYSDYVRKNGTVVPVEAGEQISEYQALQAMLMPSGNNISDSLVRWTFGSDEAYVAFANSMVKEMGLDKTVVSDASGYSPATVSSADNLARLGYAYMQSDVLRRIALEPKAKIPYAGIIQNYNTFNNKDGIVGIKVGDTDEAGKCLITAKISPSGEISIAVVLGADHLKTAADSAEHIFISGNVEN